MGEGRADGDAALTMKRLVVGFLVVGIVIVIGLMWLRPPEFPAELLDDLDSRLRSWVGEQFNYRILVAKHGSGFVWEGPWCVVIDPPLELMEAESDQTFEVNHFTMLKEGPSWVVVYYDQNGRELWSRLGCGDW